MENETKKTKSPLDAPQPLFRSLIEPSLKTKIVIRGFKIDGGHVSVESIQVDAEHSREYEKEMSHLLKAGIELYSKII